MTVVSILIVIFVALLFLVYFSEDAATVCTEVVGTGVHQIDRIRDKYEQARDTCDGNGQTISFYRRATASHLSSWPELAEDTVTTLAVVVLLSLIDSEHCLNSDSSFITRHTRIMQRYTGLLWRGDEVTTSEIGYNNMSCSAEAAAVVRCFLTIKKKHLVNLGREARRSDEKEEKGDPEDEELQNKERDQPIPYGGISNAVASGFLRTWDDPNLHKGDDGSLQHLFHLVFLVGLSYKPQRRQFDKEGITECSFFFFSILSLLNKATDSQSAGAGSCKEDSGENRENIDLDYRNMLFLCQEFKKIALHIHAFNRCLDGMLDRICEKVRRTAFAPSDSSAW
jgi:hypothetical protein